MSRHLIFAALFVVGCAHAAPAQEPLPSVHQVMSENKEKINNQLETQNYKRKRMVESNMALDGAQAETFWPIYTLYRGEMDGLNRDTFQLLLGYARAYGSGAVTDDDASKMIKTYKSLHVKRQMILNRYIDEVADKMSPIIAMRFLQIEEQLDAADILDTGSRIPLVGKAQL
ncbi:MULTISPECIES: transcriptional regulator [unclassified Pseudomonas]|uniref:transcriptional regulator n=1 Tax=unclassified Pseudomonas TaxID=196821 RepID=UPI000A1E5DE8|nr:MULTISPECIES: transcriptional regulator [unclassified Pseudomonas]